jgi:hypothetical protein
MQEKYYDVWKIQAHVMERRHLAGNGSFLKRPGKVGYL